MHFYRLTTCEVESSSPETSMGNKLWFWHLTSWCCAALIKAGLQFSNIHGPQLRGNIWPLTVLIQTHPRGSSERGCSPSTTASMFAFFSTGNHSESHRSDQEQKNTFLLAEHRQTQADSFYKSVISSLVTKQVIMNIGLHVANVPQWVEQ